MSMDRNWSEQIKKLLKYLPFVNNLKLIIKKKMSAKLVNTKTTKGGEFQLCERWILPPPIQNRIRRSQSQS